MRTYDCPYCRCSFSEADKSWDVATKSGQCPECLQLLRNFPVSTKQQEETFPAQQLKLQEEKPAAQRPYPWGSVLTWGIVAFLITVTSSVLNVKSFPLIDRFIGGVLLGIVYAVLTAVIVGSFKYYKWRK
jgi:hypothetical protein